MEKKFKDKQGYRKLIVWQNVYKMRRVSHMRDSARSAKQNIQEGYKRPSVTSKIAMMTN